MEPEYTKYQSVQQFLDHARAELLKLVGSGHPFNNRVKSQDGELLPNQPDRIPRPKTKARPSKHTQCEVDDGICVPESDKLISVRNNKWKGDEDSRDFDRSMSIMSRTHQKKHQMGEYPPERDNPCPPEGRWVEIKAEIEQAEEVLDGKSEGLAAQGSQGQCQCKLERGFSSMEVGAEHTGVCLSWNTEQGYHGIMPSKVMPHGAELTPLIRPCRSLLAAP